jgi:WbqC-like protein family
MIIAIHQPEFMPWLGFFDKMNRVDTYVVFDHVQFKKRYFENRNRIKIGDAPVWITLPVKSKKKFTQKIMEVEIDQGVNWQKKMWGRVSHAYAKSPYFKEYAAEIESLIFTVGYTRLIDFNLALIHWIRRILDIHTPVVFSSTLNIEQFKASQLILEICKRLGSGKYLCGLSGRDYLRIDDFEDAGVKVIWQEFKHPVYPQTGKEFISHLSALDLIFNCGPNSKTILFSDER